MADVVKIDRTNSNGAEVLAAAQMIAAGLAILWKLNGLRANAIGVGAAEVQAVFGVDTSGHAQTLSDRWAGLMDAAFNPAAAQYDEFVYLRDFIQGLASS